MREEKLLMSLVIITFLLSLILFTNIGYAQESTYITNTNTSIADSTFDIAFNPNSSVKSDEVTIVDSRTAILNNITLDKANETKILLIPISNNSGSTAAKVYSEITNTNPEYFNITSSISKSTLQPNSEDAIVEIKIELKKQPTTQSVTSEIKIEIHAEPIY